MPRRVLWTVPHLMPTRAFLADRFFLLVFLLAMSGPLPHPIGTVKRKMV